MSVFLEMPCMEMPCCSFGKMRWKQPGLLSTPSSRTPHNCIHTSQDRGDLMKRIVWLSILAAGTTPKDIRKLKLVLRAPRNKNDRTSDRKASAGAANHRARLRPQLDRMGLDIFPVIIINVHSPSSPEGRAHGTTERGGSELLTPLNALNAASICSILRYA